MCFITTEGYSEMAYHCPTHGFQEDVNMKIGSSDCFGFANGFLHLCKTCGKVCVAHKFCLKCGSEKVFNGYDTFTCPNCK